MGEQGLCKPQVAGSSPVTSTKYRRGGMAYATGLEPVARKGLGVQLPPAVPYGAVA